MKVKKKIIEDAYKVKMICRECGRPMYYTGHISLTYPSSYIYKCINCNYTVYLRYEIELEREKIDICTTLLP